MLWVHPYTKRGASADMSPSKVAFVTPGSFPIPSTKSSSVERVVENIAPLLNRDRIDARIYGRTGPKLARKGNVRGILCERFPAADKSVYIKAVSRAIEGFGPDIIQVENRPEYALRLKQRYPGKQVWLSLHSTSFISKPHIGTDALRSSFKACERIVVNSTFLRNNVAARVPEAASKLRVVYLGVEAERFLSQYSEKGQLLRARLREARGWENRSVVLFMGRLIPKKGVHHLLQMMPALIAAHPRVLLVIVGSAYYGSHRSTAYSRKLRQMAKPYSAHVKFVPYVPYSEVPDYFLSADVAAVPSDSGEAFGLVNVEAMACGLPVVATRAGGIKEIIEDGVTGFLVHPQRVAREMREKLVGLLSNDNLRTRIGKASRERVEQRFTWKRSAERWLELLQETE
jgi:spore coat protein SA